MLPDVHVGVCEDGIVVAIINVVPSIIRGLVNQLHLKRNLEVVERRFKEIHLETNCQLVSHRVFQERRIFIVLEGYRATPWNNWD